MRKKIHVCTCSLQRQIWGTFSVSIFDLQLVECTSMELMHLGGQPSAQIASCLTSQLVFNRCSASEIYSP